MKLRSQLLLVTVVVLLVPFAGWQFVQTIEHSLRQAHEQTLIDQAAAMARNLAESESIDWSGPSDGLYAHRTQRAIHLDGRDAEWEGWLETARELQGGEEFIQVQLVAAINRSGLHLLLKAEDRELVFGEPGQAPGDHVIVEVMQDGRNRQVRFEPLAPGWLQAQSADGIVHAQGNWQPRAAGWTLEVQIVRPARPVGIGVRVIDVDDPVTRQVVATASTLGVEPIVARDTDIEIELTRMLPDNMRGWVATPAGWIVARSESGIGQESPGVQSDDPSPLLFERLLGEQLTEAEPLDDNSARFEAMETEPATGARWLRLTDTPGVMIRARAPIVHQGALAGVVMIERSADAFLRLTNEAVVRLFATTLAAMGLIAIVLIGFAVILSERIRRLRNRTEDAVLPDGRVVSAIQPATAADEIGDLGRSLADLINRQHEHQQYLRTLADKLSHELRTPLATIRSSLDNLAEVDNAAERERYRLRADAGCRRLSMILQGMSQAARVEESLRHESSEPVDLASLMTHYVDAIRTTWPDRRFRLSLPDAGRHLVVQGSADLLAQMLDKLVENAVDFSPSHAVIKLRARPAGQLALIEVDNPGPSIPEEMLDQLFDSMVSRRPAGGDSVHLGLGLHIARLIAHHHGGTIRAFNLANGCRFQVELSIDSSGVRPSNRRSGGT